MLFRSATSYTVEGSENSAAIKEITLAQLDADQEMSHIRSEYRSGVLSDTAYRRRTLAMAEAYKQVARKYIYARPMSTAAYYALFQQVDGLLFFDPYDKADSRSFGAVATSVISGSVLPMSSNIDANLGTTATDITIITTNATIMITAGYINFFMYN